MKAVSLAIAVVSAFSFGFSGPMARFLGEAGLSPLESVWVRMAGAGLVMLLVLAIVRPRALRVPRDRMLFFAAYAVIAVAGVQGLFFFVITRLPVGVALLFEYTSPVLVVVWVRLVRQVRLAGAAYLGALVAVVGLAVVVEVWHGMRLDVIGVLAALASAACSAGYFLMSDGFGDDIDPLGLICWGMVGAAVILLPISRPWGIPWSAFARTAAVGDHALPVAGAAAWMVLVATVAAYVTGVIAVRRLSAAVGATVSSIEVIAGALIAWVLLGERLGTFQIIGGAVVLTGAMLAQSATVRRSPMRGELTLGQTIGS
ncbi:EamA family transporter [Sphaerimonospora thailandensis]|uniref:Membrane protein n=1 Tax=Sphaerimonospora thailandensis TaxID=795644 RepID=A0A8J3R7A0_9ACTN|nr:EamA family transporter [Sphaerimonospora thailandensis]GIH69299.1 membrane protein [Sphaerimonospora thailandensis]